MRTAVNIYGEPVNSQSRTLGGVDQKTWEKIQECGQRNSQSPELQDLISLTQELLNCWEQRISLHPDKNFQIKGLLASPYLQNPMHAEFVNGTLQPFLFKLDPFLAPPASMAGISTLPHPSLVPASLRPSLLDRPHPL